VSLLLLTWLGALALRPANGHQPPAVLGDSSLVNGTPQAAARRWAEATRALIETRRRQRWSLAAGAHPELDRTAPAPAPQQGPLEGVGIQFRGRFELKLDRLRNQRCTAADLGNPSAGCEAGFPTPFLDQQFSLRAGGVVSQRVHLDLDYDSQREFSTNNDLRIWYQGADGEFLQRIEIGNVTLQAPPSRFITAGIPANAFGVLARAQMGNLELATVVAQQRGSALRTRVFTLGDRVREPAAFELKDLDFEPGRFFFVTDPRAIPGYPALDILDLAAAPLPPAQKPVAVRLYRSRAQGSATGASPTLGGISAVALRRDSPQRVGPLPWELLIEGRDYYLDPSGLWFALATRVGLEDFLAVSYVTATGDTVGTFPAARRDRADTLELIYEPRRGSEVPTFAYEMRNVYRVGGPDIDRGSLELAILLNQSERPLGGGASYLEALGLAAAGTPSALDTYNRVFPRERDPNGGAPLRDLFVIFPHLQPFADSLRLTPAERNDSLYRTPVYLLQTQGPAPRFRLRVRYETAAVGDRSTLNLGAIQVREGSERVFLGDRQLVRGRDYEVFYDLGQVTLLNSPELLAQPGAQVRVEFEENQVFDLAPKTIAGITGTYRIPSVGQIHALGLFQQEQTVFTRPQLGFEPRTHMMGGLGVELGLESARFTQALDRLPMLHASGPSFVRLSGEVALSQPNANAAGTAYVEEFEGAGGSRAISLAEQAFQLGSRPSSGRGLPPHLLAPDGGFDLENAVPLVWQNGVQVGGRPIEFEPRDIDSSIVLTGTSRQLERVLWLSLKPDTVGGAPDPLSGRPRWVRPHRNGPRWRSITQALDRAGLGIDLSTAEFLEFWVLEDDQRSAAASGTTLLLDFGTVFEDAVAPAPDSFLVAGADTVFSGLQFVGLGRLDTERDSLTNVFNATLDDVGILADRPDSLIEAGTGRVVRSLPLCRGTLATTFPIFPLGDLAARCTRANGLLDTEDLDGDNRLDLAVGGLAEHVIRYVFPLGSTRYFVRQGGSTVDAAGRRYTWRLYRIPFRQDSVLVGQPDLRHVRALRLTVVAAGSASAGSDLVFALARMRLVGAPWLKRAATPLAGLGGREVQVHGEVTASSVSTENRDLGYTPPPGVLDQPDRRGAALQFTSQQINEHALRLVASDLRPGERAEAFTRFVIEGDRSFLKYRQLRIWAQGRGEGWDTGDFEFFVKAGTDEHNFYLYRTRRAAGTWEPEIVVDLSRWIALRGAIEARWLNGEQPGGAAQCGGDSSAYVACDGPYLVHVRDPAISPPNLAGVSEVAVGIYRVAAASAADRAEVWVDDIRLADVVNRTGLAASLDAHLSAADVADLSLGLSRRGDQFRQLEEDPSYVTDARAALAGTLRLERFLPPAWKVALPVSVAHQRTGADPFYLQGTDVPAAALRDLRRPHQASTRVQFEFRRTARGGGLLPRLLLDPLSLTASVGASEARSERWTSRSRDRRVRAEYAYAPAPLSVPAVPRFVIRLLDALPGWLRDSEFGRSLRNARLRLNPALVRWQSHLVDDDTRRFTFRLPVTAAAESLGRPTPAIFHRWTNQAGLELKPFETASLSLDWNSMRDLQDYGDTTTVGRLLRAQRSTWLGRDVGFERQRSLGTAIRLTPRIGSWLAPRLAWSSGFSLVRDPSRSAFAPAGGDSALPLVSANVRRRQLGLGLDLGRLAGSGVAGALLRGLLPAELSLITERRSSFDRTLAEPPLRYQLALGSLDEFRIQDGTLAATAARTRTATAAGGMRLPLGFALRAAYRETDATTWVRQGQAQVPLTQRTLEWPAGSVTWNLRPRGGWSRAVARVDAQAQYRASRSTLSQGLAGSTSLPAVSDSRMRFFAPSLNVDWRSGMTTSAQWNYTVTEITAAGSMTRSERAEASGNLGFAFRAPRWLVRLPAPVRTTVSGSTSDTKACLRPATEALCLPVADSRRRQLDLRLDTGVAASVVAGASMSYILTEQRHLSSRFDQYVVTLFAEVNLIAGRVP